MITSSTRERFTPTIPLSGLANFDDGGVGKAGVGGVRSVHFLTVRIGVVVLERFDVLVVLTRELLALVSVDVTLVRFLVRETELAVLAAKGNLRRFLDAELDVLGHFVLVPNVFAQQLESREGNAIPAIVARKLRKTRLRVRHFEKVRLVQVFLSLFQPPIFSRQKKNNNKKEKKRED